MKNDRSLTDSLNNTFPVVFPEILPLRTKTELPKILEENVGNFCPSCEKTIFSNLLEIDGKVYLEKNCCKKELIYMENDVDFFLKHKKNTTITPPVPDAKNYKEAMYKNPNYGVSVVLLTDITMRCNMDCPGCYLKFTKNTDALRGPSDDVPLEKIKQALEKYTKKEVYIYGAEPTMREDLCDIIKAVKDSGNFPAIITNGLKLVNKSYLEGLKRSGLKVVALTFDGFNKEVNKKLRGRDYLAIRFKALKNLKEVGGIRVSLMTVIGKGFNEEEMHHIIQFALKNKFIDRVQFTQLMFEDPEHKMTPSPSDLIKIMEREKYFDREYFLELVKMHRNIYETATKIFSKTPLEKLIFTRLPGYFETVLFKKGLDSPQLFFQKSDIDKINGILEIALKKKSRMETIFTLLKNCGKLINSPLAMLFKKNFFYSQRTSSPDETLRVTLHWIKFSGNRFLNTSRRNAAFGLGRFKSYTLATG